MNITGWTQVSDYSSTDLGAVSFEQAANAVVSFPWADRLHEFAERVLRQQDACPPGVGFNSDEKDVFHVYAVALDEWQIYLTLSRPGRILGLFPKPARTLSSAVKTLEQVLELLRLFFAEDKERLMAEARRHPSGEPARATPG